MVWLLRLAVAVAVVCVVAVEGRKEETIQDVSALQLTDLAKSRDYVAVYWYKKGCPICDKVLAELETIDDDSSRYGVLLVKMADKKFARSHGVKAFPSLTFFRGQEPMHFTGDLMDEGSVLDFLTSLEAMQLPDRIEEVNAKILDKVVEEHTYVAAVFYDGSSKSSVSALASLENIDDEADQLGIAFVKLQDQELTIEYNLEPLPTLVYYRKRIPVVYDGDIEEEDKVLTWLVENKSTGEDDDVIGEVTAGLLNSLVDSTAHLAVIFYDKDDPEELELLEGLETIDDDLDDEDIHIVKISDEEVAASYGIDSTPAMVYFENEIPMLFDGSLEEEGAVLGWLKERKSSDEIEDVTDEMLAKLVKETDGLATLFYNSGDANSALALSELENIDDECDANGIAFVKIDNDVLAEEYGLDTLPALVYFEGGIPSVYTGSLLKEEEVLKWLIHQANSDDIEDITGAILDSLIKRSKHLAVLFYDRDQRRSTKVLTELENIDDECDQNGVKFVKVSDTAEAKEYGLNTLPALVYFENEIPYIYNGDLMKEEVVLSWLLHHVAEEEIAEVTDEMLDKLIVNEPKIAVLFYEKSDEEDQEVLDELEKIDVECERAGIPFVKMADTAAAREYGIEKLPTLVYFEQRIPSLFEGDLLDEATVLAWLQRQASSDTIERVTDEILTDLVESFEYVVVYFSGECSEGDDCADILESLENIDDDTDAHGMHFVTTEETTVARDHGVAVLPALALFRNGEVVVYPGDLSDEQKVLRWLTDEDTLEIPNKIEEVNGRMLEKLLNVSENLAVFFYDDGHKRSRQALVELENIDDECDDVDIDFVKISDLDVAEAHSIDTLPSLVYFRSRVPRVYTGDLFEEDAVLEWLLDNKNSGPLTVIEKVEGADIDDLADEFDYLVVYYYSGDCATCEEVLRELETIDDEADDAGIKFVKTSDSLAAQVMGLQNLPGLVYFEGGVPSVYDGDLTVEEEVLGWLIEQRQHDTIENINRQLLHTLVDKHDYLAVYFFNEENKECISVLRTLEKIDDDAGEFGVHLVKINDRLMAKKYGIRNPPGLVYFRKGKFIMYEGDLLDDEDILDWLTAPENMELNDAIEKVNRKMFERIKNIKEYLAVFFYKEVGCKQCQKVLQELENIDDEADANGIDFVKLDDREIARDVGVFALPAIVFYRTGVEEPVIYAGDLRDEDAILSWLLKEKNPGSDYIEEIRGEALNSLIREQQAVAVFFYANDSAQCEQCSAILEELENIDDDTDRLDIKFVKTQEVDMAEKYGVMEMPSLLYFEHQIPTVFEGDLSAEEDVLQWLVLQKTEDTIETVNRNMLQVMMTEQQYLAVYFYKPACRACDAVLLELEHIDDDCDSFGIQMVKIQDPQFAKRYAIKTLPALVYFRNGNPLVYDGDLLDEETVLDWILDEETRKLEGEIEEINRVMLDHLIDDNPLVAVFFYDADCSDCDEVLRELENIDELVDEFGIDFVKINDPEVAQRYNVLNTPSLVFFRKKKPLVYEGDLLDEEKVSRWLTSQEAFEVKDEIEEVNRKMLSKLLDENEFVAVYFYNPQCAECDEVLSGLETIDDDTDSLDIIFVKIKDSRYAKKYGLNKLPAVAYFRKRFPSVFRGELRNSTDVLEWLQKNRYRQPELNIFMYGTAILSLLFILYTVFLVSFFNQTHVKTS